MPPVATTNFEHLRFFMLLAASIMDVLALRPVCVCVNSFLFVIVSMFCSVHLFFLFSFAYQRTSNYCGEFLDSFPFGRASEDISLSSVKVPPNECFCAAALFSSFSPRTRLFGACFASVFWNWKKKKN
eukprot:RCo020912